MELSHDRSPIPDTSCVVLRVVISLEMGTRYEGVANVILDNEKKLFSWNALFQEHEKEKWKITGPGAELKGGGRVPDPRVAPWALDPMVNIGFKNYLKTLLNKRRGIEEVVIVAKAPLVPKPIPPPSSPPPPPQPQSITPTEEIKTDGIIVLEEREDQPTHSHTLDDFLSRQEQPQTKKKVSEIMNTMTTNKTCKLVVSMVLEEAGKSGTRVTKEEFRDISNREMGVLRQKAVWLMKERNQSLEDIMEAVGFNAKPSVYTAGSAMERKIAADEEGLGRDMRRMLRTIPEPAEADNGNGGNSSESSAVQTTTRGPKTGTRKQKVKDIPVESSSSENGSEELITRSNAIFILWCVFGLNPKALANIFGAKEEEITRTVGELAMSGHTPKKVLSNIETRLKKLAKK